MQRIKKYKRKLPHLTTQQMIEVDRLMTEEFGIELVQMMENAGRCLATVAISHFLKRRLGRKKVVVLAGTGGNGGGAMVCARRLHNVGVEVSVFVSQPPNRMTPVTRQQHDILARMKVPIRMGDHLNRIDDVDLIVDGLLGYSIQGDPRGLVKDMILWANDRRVPILSLDTPSGLDLTTGQLYVPTISASATLTLALPKQGLFSEAGALVRGRLFLGDISVPSELYEAKSLKLKVSSKIFRDGDVVRLL